MCVRVCVQKSVSAQVCTGACTRVCALWVHGHVGVCIVCAGIYYLGMCACECAHISMCVVCMHVLCAQVQMHECVSVLCIYIIYGWLWACVCICVWLWMNVCVCEVPGCVLRVCMCIHACLHVHVTCMCVHVSAYTCVDVHLWVCLALPRSSQTEFESRFPWKQSPRQGLRAFGLFGIVVLWGGSFSFCSFLGNNLYMIVTVCLLKSWWNLPTKFSGLLRFEQGDFD